VTFLRQHALATELRFYVPKDRFVVHVRPLKDGDQVFDDLIRVPASLCPLPPIDLAQLLASQAVLDFGGQLPDEWHSAFERKACAEEEARKGLHGDERSGAEGIEA
jgi:hypothetical protein